MPLPLMRASSSFTVPPKGPFTSENGEIGEIKRISETLRDLQSFPINRIEFQAFEYGPHVYQNETIQLTVKDLYEQIKAVKIKHKSSLIENHQSNAEINPHMKKLLKYRSLRK